MRLLRGVGKPIYVALAQRKEVRRAQLEAHHGQRMSGLPRGIPMQPTMYPGAPMYYGVPPMTNPTVGAMARGGVPNIPYYTQPMMNGGMGQLPPVPRGTIPMNPSMQRAGMTGPMNQYRQIPMAANPMMYNGAASMGMVGAQNAAAAARRGRPRTNPRQQRVGIPGGIPTMPVMMPSGKFPQPNPSQQPQPLPQNQPLTAAELANATEEQRKNIIGERLYPLISLVQPKLAGKITGMLLDLDNAELLHLIESPNALNDKIAEAMQVLETHNQSGSNNPSSEQ